MINVLFGDTRNVIFNKLSYTDAQNMENSAPLCGSTVEAEKVVGIRNIL